MALSVADKLSNRIEIEVIDPRIKHWTRFDLPIGRKDPSVCRGQRGLVPADIFGDVAAVMEECFWTSGPHQKEVCNKDVPVPVAAALEDSHGFGRDILDACLEVWR